MKILISAFLGIGEIVLIAACALIVVGVTVAAIVRKAKGKTGCGGNCGSCSACSRCNADNNRKSK